MHRARFAAPFFTPPAAELAVILPPALGIQAREDFIVLRVLCSGSQNRG